MVVVPMIPKTNIKGWFVDALLGDRIRRGICRNSARSYSAEVPFRLGNSDILGSHESLTVVVRVRGSAFLAFPLVVASVTQTQGEGGRRVGQGALG
jgi:hypothetical protein